MVKPKWTRWLGATTWYAVIIPAILFVLTLMGAPTEVMDVQPRLLIADDASPTATKSLRQMQIENAQAVTRPVPLPLTVLGLSEQFDDPVELFLNSLLSNRSLETVTVTISDNSNKHIGINLVGELTREPFLVGERFRQISTTSKSENPISLAPSEIMASSASSFYWQPDQNTGQQLMLWALGAVFVLAGVWLAHQLRKLTLSARHNGLFSTTNGWRVLRIGGVVMGLGLVHLAFVQLIANWVYEQYQVYDWPNDLLGLVQPHLPSLLAGVLLALLAKVILSGAALKREQELTV